MPSHPVTSSSVSPPNRFIEILCLYKRRAGTLREDPSSLVDVSPGDFVPRNPLTPSLAGAPCPAPLRRLVRCAHSRSQLPVALVQFLAQLREMITDLFV